MQDQTMEPAPIESGSRASSGILVPTRDQSVKILVHRAKPNVGQSERIVSTAAGALLLFYGVHNFWSLKGQLANLAGLGLLGRGVTGRCMLYRALGVDSTPQGREQQKSLLDPHPVMLHHSITIWKPIDEVFGFCRDMSQVALYMPFVNKVQVIDPSLSRWVLKRAEEQQPLAVDIEIIEEIVNDQVSWRIAPPTPFDVSGTLRFRPAPQNRGTEVQAYVRINPPAGAVGAALVKSINPINRGMLSLVLHRLKQRMETGEVATIDGQPSGRRSEGRINRLKKSITHPLLERFLQGFGRGRVVV